MPGSIPFLMLHELLAPGAEPTRTGRGYARYVIKGTDFVSHLGAIRDSGSTGISVSQALEPDGLPRVTITFDDGCASDLLVAAPALADAGFCATFFVTTDWLNTTGFLSNAQLRELSRAGFEIGSHGVDHAYLSDLPPDRLRQQLVESRDRLTQVTGLPVQHLSCPGGRWNHHVASIAAELGYQTVCDSSPRPFVPGSDTLRIGRYAITVGVDSHAVARLIRTSRWRGTGARALVLSATKKILGNQLYDRIRGIVIEKA